MKSQFEIGDLVIVDCEKYRNTMWNNHVGVVIGFWLDRGARHRVRISGPDFSIVSFKFDDLRKL